MEGSPPRYALIDDKRALIEREDLIDDEILQPGLTRLWRTRFLVGKPFLAVSILLHAALAVISAGSLFATIIAHNARCAPGPNLIHSPAREAVKYETWTMDNKLEEENPFKLTDGKPTHESTLAWRNLLKWQVTVVSEDDLRTIGHLRSTSPKFEDGSGYFAQLDVFHQLHCLNYVREYIHRDYYEITESPEIQVVHVDHCIDTLRQIAMCHADIALVTYDWIPGRKMPFPNFAVERECRSWDSIMEYVKAKQPVNDTMINPELGPITFHNGMNPMD